MKNNSDNTDTIQLTIELNELKSALDRSMREEDSFQHCKKLYHQIKEMECQLHALQWHPYSFHDNFASM